MEPKFCECCGISLDELRNEIKENGIPLVEGGKQLRYGKHILYQNGDVYSNDNYVIYCCECGSKLNYEDYEIIYESHPWGSTTATEELLGGYRCNNCGNKVEF